MKDFKIGETTTRVLKNVSLKVLRENLFQLWDSLVPEKVHFYIF